VNAERANASPPTTGRRIRRAHWLLGTWLLLWAAFSLPWTSVSSSPHWERARPPRIRSSSRLRPDHVLNLLFYVPAVPLGAALDCSLPGSVIASAALSIAAEGTQLFSTDRAPDGNDIVANIGGAVIGAIGVLVYRRRSASAED
jgi:VanZ family protein